MIDHREYEHASVPATIERLWGLPSMTDRDNHARDLGNLLSLPSPRTDTPQTLPPAARPEVSCPASDAVAGPSEGLTARPSGATLFDAVTLARASQHNPAAITSTTGAFLLTALRRDLLLSPRIERRPIFNQVRQFQTMGEVAIYARAVITEIRRSKRTSSERRNVLGRLRQLQPRSR